VTKKVDFCDFSTKFSPNKFFLFSKITLWGGGFYPKNRLRALKNIKNASLTPNQPNKPDVCNFWADLRSGKRFQDFSMSAIDSSHRKPPIELFMKK
jgi:hypothetical protein